MKSLSLKMSLAALALVAGVSTTVVTASVVMSSPAEAKCPGGTWSKCVAKGQYSPASCSRLC